MSHANSSVTSPINNCEASLEHETSSSRLKQSQVALTAIALESSPFLHVAETTSPEFIGRFSRKPHGLCSQKNAHTKHNHHTPALTPLFAGGFRCLFGLPGSFGPPPARGGFQIVVSFPGRRSPLCRTRRHFFPLTRSFVTAPPTEGDSKKDDEKWTNADYINSNASQTVILAFGSAILGLLNPHRADLIAILGETTGSVALNRIKSSMERTLEGRLILEQKPRVNSKTVPLEALLEQDPNTFGYAYARFMTGHGYSADDRPVVKHIRDIELSYIMQRYREVHDFWHVLTGAPTTVEGEIGQKAFEFLQTGLPMAALSTAVGPLRLTNNQRKRILTGYLPWAYACNQRCNFLMGVRFEDYFQEDLKDFRDMLGVVPVSEYVTEIDEETS